MTVFIVLGIVVVAVVTVLIYRNNQKKIEVDASKVQDFYKSTTDAAKKL